MEIVGNTYIHVHHEANSADLPLMVSVRKDFAFSGGTGIHLDWNEIHCMHNGKLQEVLHSKVSQNDLGTFKDKQVTIHIVIYSTPSSKKRNSWFANSDVPFHSECSKRFVTRPIRNANVCATSGGCYSSKKLLLCRFRCSISECNKRFVTRPIHNANICATSGGCYILNCHTLVVCACAE